MKGFLFLLGLHWVHVSHTATVNTHTHTHTHTHSNCPSCPIPPPTPMPCPSLLFFASIFSSLFSFLISPPISSSIFYILLSSYVFLSRSPFSPSLPLSSLHHSLLLVC